MLISLLSRLDFGLPDILNLISRAGDKPPEFFLCAGKYVIDGKVHLMETGDILIFEATLPHLWRNPFDVEAKFILVLQTPNASREPVQRHYFSHPSVNHIGG